GTDLPGGTGSGISKVWVTLHYYGSDGLLNTGDDLYWNDLSQSWTSSPSASTVTAVANAWSYTIDPSYWHSNAGAQYLVMSQAFDNGRDGSFPFAINGTQEAAPTVVGSPNYHYFIVDSTAPTAAITVPNTSPTNFLPS